MNEKLMKGNKEFIDTINSNKEFKDLNESLIANGQHPYALVITCSDSRVIPELIFNKTLGEIFVIRTAGNVINDGELGTIEYAIEHLKIKEIIVLAHTYCGAVHAAVHKESGKYINKILDKIKTNIGSETDEVKASILNANKVKDYILKQFPGFDGKVISAIYDLKTNIVKKV
ncbi:MAG: carbonic anhydrase [bacterium]|nr:carbonic anhydrase [bacterium]